MSSNLPRKCLIVGAGIAGLMAARTLRNAGLDATLVDKGRRAGGRMATRRVEDAVFDHGAQFITVRGAEFSSVMEQWRKQGLVVEWASGFPFAAGGEKDEETGDSHPRYRGVAGMNSLPQSLTEGLDIAVAERLVSITAGEGQWTATAESGRSFSAAAVILTPPVPQSLALLEGTSEWLAPVPMESLRAIRYHRCLAAMLLLDGPSDIPAPGGLRFDGEPIAWMADNYQKGVSPRTGAVTIHAAPQFSEEHWDTPEDVVTGKLYEAAARWLGGRRIIASQLHRWRFSQPVNPLNQPCVFTATPLPLAFAGDAFGRPRVEGAALSGIAAAKSLLEFWRDPNQRQ